MYECSSCKTTGRQRLGHWKPCALKWRRPKLSWMASCRNLLRGRSPSISAGVMGHRVQAWVLEATAQRSGQATRAPKHRSCPKKVSLRWRNSKSQWSKRWVRSWARASSRYCRNSQLPGRANPTPRNRPGRGPMLQEEVHKGRTQLAVRHRCGHPRRTRRKVRVRPGNHWQRTTVHQWWHEGTWRVAASGRYQGGTVQGLVRGGREATYLSGRPFRTRMLPPCPRTSGEVWAVRWYPSAQQPAPFARSCRWCFLVLASLEPRPSPSNEGVNGLQLLHPPACHLLLMPCLGCGPRGSDFVVGWAAAGGGHRRGPADWQLLAGSVPPAG